ncbi:MAG: TPM domain-containing protein [Rubrivivax sp.]
MNLQLRLRHSLAASIAIALLAGGCGGTGPAGSEAVSSKATTPVTGARAASDESALVAEVADALQACSYDGEPVQVSADGMGNEPPTDCRDMVAKIMNFTGLPQNFDVMEAQVPNAAAVILLDDQKLPHRVIAFNRDFIDVVRRETGNSNWAPVSIMAHEIGHHLSGHTIMPGGSQPPTELEADKFSGFVLYKMGAALGDAQKAMVTLVADGPDSPTHPGRGKRMTAIAEGWQQACQQQGGSDCGGGAGAAPAGPQQSPVAVTPATSQPARPLPGLPAANATAIAAASAPNKGRDVLPAPGSTPSKFNQFVYDEFGVLDPAERARVEKKMYEHAKATGVEVVTLLVDDLHGMSAQDYAYAMMRQLRVGKLDVGNGALLVVAPKQNDAAIAMGPGVMLESKSFIEGDSKRLRNFLDMGWDWCQKKGNCGGWTQQFFGASEHIASGTRSWEWTIRYQSLADILSVYKQGLAMRAKSSARYDPKTDPTWRKIVRVRGTVVDRTPDKSNRKLFVNSIHEKLVGGAILVRTDNGSDVMVYVNPHTEALMPGGKLQEGRMYSLVVREHSLADTPQLDLLSYDALN